MPIFTEPTSKVQYSLIAFDSNGNERKDDPDGIDGSMSAKVCDLIFKDHEITDIFVISHGWLDDEASARSRYNSWVSTMNQYIAQIKNPECQLPSYKPMTVAFHWPSKPLGNESFQSSKLLMTKSPHDLRVPDGKIDTIAAKSVDTPEARKAIAELVQIMDKPEPNMAIRSEQSRDASRVPENLKLSLLHELFDQVKGPVEVLIDQIQSAFRKGGRSAADKTLALYNAIATAEGPNTTHNSIVQKIFETLSFWSMKELAMNISRGSGNRLLRQLMMAVEKRSVRFHLVGHSFGTIIVSGMITGHDNADSSLPCSVATLSLIQGAVTIWAYCQEVPDTSAQAGVFHRIKRDKLVSGPIITTQSCKDLAVGIEYPLATSTLDEERYDVTKQVSPFGAYAGLGNSGARGRGIAVVDLRMLPLEQPYKYIPNCIHNIDAVQFIKDGDPPSGAHCDILKPEVAHAIWQAVLASATTKK